MWRRRGSVSRRCSPSATSASPSDRSRVESGAFMTVHASKKAVYVPAGRDRHGDHLQKIWGLIPLATKVSTADTEGSLYLFMHHEMGVGGPPRHVHHEQDEWFFVVKGEYVMEVGEERFRLKP